MCRSIVCLVIWLYVPLFIYAQVDTLKISGSKYLCDIIQNLLSDFYAIQPNCVVKFISADNTPHALSDFIMKGVDIALTTQPLPESDKKKFSFYYKEQEFARDAIVFYTNHKNNVKGLTLSQIYEVFIEKIHDWSDINGKNEKITLIAYPLGHDFTLYLYKHAWNREYYSINAVMVESTEQFQNKLNSNHYTLGYTAHSMKVKGNIIPILINGNPIFPNEETILSGKYPFTYSCYAVISSEKPSANKFLEWLMLPSTKKKLKTYNLYCFLL
ncbi:MAG: substrate-binding domain-containing protein [Bacteroidia bacterium]|nr:substrate-binding domain-containing protein [Bacteroidia bacterium]MDW8346834.1 substrate-binding domain-containing protein [Bacteroidia bacterium]